MKYPTNHAFLPPIYQSLAYSIDNFSDWQTHLAGEKQFYTYHTDGNPTNEELEDKLCGLQGKDACYVTSSGKSAIAKILISLLQAGDHVLLPREVYRSTRFFITDVLSKFGITYSFVDLYDPDGIVEASSNSKTKLLFLESPSNPMTRIADLEYLSEFCKERGIISILDNSLASFLNHQEFDFDVFVHSLSKYCTGVADVMGGAILGSREIVSKIRKGSIWFADSLDASVASVLFRGLETFPLRYKHQSDNALQVSEALSTHSYFSRVYYPGLKSHPDHMLARRQMKYFGNIISFDLMIKPEKMPIFFDTLKIWKLAFGAGFTQSIIGPSQLFYSRGFIDEATESSSIHPTTVRLSVGLEPASVLVNDLIRAVECV